MRQIVSDKNKIAFCGLYCGACKKYLNEKCPGCAENKKAGWCQIRKCCLEKEILSCADCDVCITPEKCKKFNNIISKIFGFIFNSNRPACIALIKEKGYEAYAEEMTRRKSHSLKRK